MDAFGIRAIHPRPERRGFSRSPVRDAHRFEGGMHGIPLLQVKCSRSQMTEVNPALFMV
ncbi:hypothetical protein FEMY_17870 [Ferrovum myxofaciens]|uniref:Uncharacterized protein n=1 Tax=Ferrovum myxofaciens TaxID=416213 RepID=A0A149VWS6_9PROT|nr:hypothetical protein FEMY_17870 [Ferrovum myxofaciens]